MMLGVVFEFNEENKELVISKIIFPNKWHENQIVKEVNIKHIMEQANILVIHEISNYYLILRK